MSGYAASSKDCGNSNLPTDNSQVQGQSSNINPQCRLLCAGSSSSSSSSSSRSSQAQAGARWLHFIYLNGDISRISR
ncbi:MAG TPA: hypothetical protein VFD60_05105 [Nitrososphaeraceae archaeon]|nr:hypothetical protein [Nitrososphaeraceae archaeon]